jgi:hypothetical protein
LPAIAADQAAPMLNVMAASRASLAPTVDSCMEFRGRGQCFDSFLRQIKNGKPKGFPFFVPRVTQITATMALVTASMLL